MIRKALLKLHAFDPILNLWLLVDVKLHALKIVSEVNDCPLGGKFILTKTEKVQLKFSTFQRVIIV